MTLRPAFLVAILVYVTLDLSFAMMPGAFQFEPADSVETVHGGRARLVEKTAALPAVPGNGLVLLPTPVEVKDGRARPAPGEGHEPVMIAWSPRAARAPAPTSQDPH